METTGASHVGKLPSELFAFASALAAFAARSCGALTASARSRGDDVIDAENHHGGVRGRGDRLGTDAPRLDDVLLPHVRHLAGEDVHARVLVPLAVLLPDRDQRVNRVQARVLRERPGYDLHPVREGLDRNLLAAADGGGV